MFQSPPSFQHLQHRKLGGGGEGAGRKEGGGVSPRSQIPVNLNKENDGLTTVLSANLTTRFAYQNYFFVLTIKTVVHKTVLLRPTYRGLKTLFHM